VVDGLVIDSAAPLLVRQASTVTASTRTVARPAFPSVNAVNYPYPMPLFGPPVDPLFGYEPPLITYPPWWQPLSESRTRQVIDDALAETELTPLPNADLAPGSIELTLDRAGYARLRGKVPSDAMREGLVARVRQQPGVVGVIDRLEVDPNAPPPQLGSALPPPRSADPRTTVPPPPAPGLGVAPEPTPPAANPPGPPVPFVPTSPRAAANPPQADLTSLASRVRAAIEADPQASTVADLTVTTQPGGVRLTGRAADARGAIAAVQQAQTALGTGQSVDDRIEVAGPPAGQPNPLAQLSTDLVEPYLATHLGRNLGPSIRLERLEASGSHLQILALAPDEPAARRAGAAIRSMPLLRGLDLEISIHTP
jgi:osmotically-inducible protein OsmY